MLISEARQAEISVSILHDGQAWPGLASENPNYHISSKLLNPAGE